MADLISELGIERQKLSMVRVTNRNSFIMRDRFDAVPYTFRPNKPEVIPPLAAMHFFNWPGDEEEMKAHTTRRFGWNRPSHVGADKNYTADDMFDQEGKTLADLYWSNLRIEQVNYAIVPEDLSMPEAEPDIPLSDRPLDPVPPADELTHSGGGRKGRKLEL